MISLLPRVVELQTAHAAYGKPVSGVPGAQAKRTRSLIVKARNELNQETRRRLPTKEGAARIPCFMIDPVKDAAAGAILVLIAPIL